jgi:hypothetical protein
LGQGITTLVCEGVAGCGDVPAQWYVQQGAADAWLTELHTAGDAAAGLLCNPKQRGCVAVCCCTACTHCNTDQSTRHLLGCLLIKQIGLAHVGACMV